MNIQKCNRRNDIRHNKQVKKQIHKKKKADEKIKREIYKVNKRTLAQKLGVCGFPLSFTTEERQLQIQFGTIPDSWDFHHILMKSIKVDDSIENLALITKRGHGELNKILNNKGIEFTESDRPTLKKLAISKGGLVIEMTY